MLQQLLKNNITTLSELAQFLVLEPEQRDRLEPLVQSFPFSIPPYYLSLIHKDDPEDPIRKMCVPDAAEADPDGSFDTSGESSNTVLTGMQHKYGPTAMILTTSACAMYCRHCFRKRLVGRDEQETHRDREQTLAYIQQHTEINNVLLSGGDALLNSNRSLARYLEGLCAVPHLDIIRIATRTPVVLPMRIYEDNELLDLLKHYGRRKRLCVVTQFNHPRELTPQALKALEALYECNLVVRNQTVLMKGVNDAPNVFGALMRGLVSLGVVPYYVFQCRPVTGVKNRFQVPIARGFSIVEEARRQQSGLGKGFRYILSHETGKIEILGRDASDTWLFRYHQAKNRLDAGRLFGTALAPGQCWLSMRNVGHPREARFSSSG